MQQKPNADAGLTATRSHAMSMAKSIGVCCLIWLAVAYFGVALYGRIASTGTTAWYSDTVDATCILEKRLDQIAMSCLPGDRMNQQGATP
jgi:hypothetical protein